MGDEFVALVLLLRRPIEVEITDLRERFGRLFGVRFGDIPTDANTMIQIKGEVIAISVHGLRFGLISVDRPYWNNSLPNLERYDARSRQAILYHRAWLSVDMAGTTAAAHKNQAYALLGRMLATFVDNNCMAICATET